MVAVMKYAVLGLAAANRAVSGAQHFPSTRGPVQLEKSGDGVTKDELNFCKRHLQLCGWTQELTAPVGDSGRGLQAGEECAPLSNNPLADISNGSNIINSFAREIFGTIPNNTVLFNTQTGTLAVGRDVERAVYRNCDLSNNDLTLTADSFLEDLNLADSVFCNANILISQGSRFEKEPSAEKSLAQQLFDVAETACEGANIQTGAFLHDEVRVDGDEVIPVIYGPDGNEIQLLQDVFIYSVDDSQGNPKYLTITLGESCQEASPPTNSPTRLPTDSPTRVPTPRPTKSPTVGPTKLPTASPTKSPTASPTVSPSGTPTLSTPAPNTAQPVVQTRMPSTAPVQEPSMRTKSPSIAPAPNDESASPSSTPVDSSPSTTVPSTPNPTRLGSPNPSSVADSEAPSGSPVEFEADEDSKGFFQTGGGYATIGVLATSFVACLAFCVLCGRRGGE